MRKTIIFSILLMTILFSYSQTPVGLKYDLNGIPLNGYFDPFIYSPEKKLTKTHNSDSYEVGYYYDSVGNKIDGLIKFENAKIFFKKKKEDFRIKIKPEEINHFVIGVDSFFVISNFYFENRIKNAPEFVQFITEFDGYTFVKHYHFTSGIAQQYAMQPPIKETFLAKAKDSLLWDNFPNNKRFKERALKYFRHIPYLKDRISSGDYTNDDMLSVIKMTEYYNKYKNSERIFYDKYWQEIRDFEKAVYTAKITNKVDSIWTFEYFNDSTKLYQANYSSFYPNTKNGDFISYYPDGEIRQIVSYTNNKPKEVKIFSETGLLNTHYQYIEKKNEYTSETDIGIKYIAFNDSLGNNILKTNNKSIVNMYDELVGISYTGIFNKNEMSSLYRLKGADTIFQNTNTDYDFKIKSLQKKFDFYMSEKKYDKALSVNAQGIILMSLLIDNKGYVLEGTVLNDIHPEIDTLVGGFIKRRLLEGAEYRYKFKPYKKNKIKRYCEVVIPIDFSINRFYRRPVNYSHFHHMHWQNQMMQRQMMNNFRPPNMPSGIRTY